MKNKANPNEFYITFDATDPRHKAAMDILNSKGRKKAQFIADAVLSYTTNQGSLERNLVRDASIEPEKPAKNSILSGLSKFKES